MNISVPFQTRDEGRQTVIALHCSGGNAHQWQPLRAELSPQLTLHTPEHYGTGNVDPWHGSREFTLADEAEQSLRIIDRTDGDVHLIGHSYGGSLALHLALLRPHRIASLALYEPCAFHLLPQLGPIGARVFSEIRGVAQSIVSRIEQGDLQLGMSQFVDYWNGAGAWSTLNAKQKNYLLSWAPNAVHGFHALFNEPTALQEYRALQIPVRLLQGKLSPQPVKVISNALLGLLPDCQIDRLSDIGHMGPVTHADYISRLLSAHLESYRSHCSGNSHSSTKPMLPCGFSRCGVDTLLPARSGNYWQ